MEKIDRRVKKSRQAIETAFLDMLLEEGFDTLSVKRLTEKADISRKTFYLHFTDKYQLLETIVETEIAKLAETCEQEPDNDLVQSSLVWFAYFNKNQELFAALFKSESTDLFKKHLLSYLMTEIGGEISHLGAVEKAEIITRFLSTAVLGIVESFVMGELTLGCNEVAKEVGYLLEHNLGEA